MKEVTKDQFKETYFKLGGGAATGWGPTYWKENFEDDEKSKGMKFFVEEPETPKHTRMMIVTDYDTRAYRLFFMTEEEEDGFLEFPDSG
jgi:hypothetical protein